MEELNISIVIKQKLIPVNHDYDNFEINLIPFMAEYTAGTLTLHEHCQVGWYTLDELQTLDWAPADIPVLAQLL